MPTDNSRREKEKEKEAEKNTQRMFVITQRKRPNTGNSL